MPSNELKETAIQYAKKGYSILPVMPDESRRPRLSSWKEFQEKPPSEEQIKQWFTKWPDSGIAIITGKVSGIDSIDIDSPEAEERLLEETEEDFLQCDMPVCTTPRGKHLFFASIGKRSLDFFTEDGEKQRIEYKGEGSCIIVPPTVRKSGKVYKWQRSIFDINPPEMPASLYNIINKYNNSNILYCKNDANDVDKGGQMLTNVDNLIPEGTRDDTLFRIANCLVKGEMKTKEIQLLLRLIALRCCDPPFPEREVNAKINSAIQRAEKKDRNYTDEIWRFIMLTNSDFSLTDVDKECHLLTLKEKRTRSKILGRFVDRGYIERTGQRYGQFRKIDTEAEAINWLDAPTEHFDIKWPLGIEDYALLYPKNLAVIAGSKDAGKTAFALNIARMNRNKQIRYLSSEMGNTELKRRLSSFDESLENWKPIDFRERTSNFSDIVLPDGITIVDFYEISDQFWRVAEDLRRIYEKLNNGVCIVCLQKSENKEMGRGADFALEKPRIYLTLDANPPAGGIARIYRAKNFAQPNVNPRGLEKHFKIYGGAEIEGIGNWHRPRRKEKDDGFI